MTFLLVHYGEEESFQKSLWASEFVTKPHRTLQGRLRCRPCSARTRRFVGDRGQTDGRTDGETSGPRNKALRTSLSTLKCSVNAKLKDTSNK